jgi:hypothetical protein
VETMVVRQIPLDTGSNERMQRRWAPLGISMMVSTKTAKAHLNRTIPS